ncbi:unnamed protein product [Prorocentrum cordatum]|uniref:Uncharacterized protein n=1 Tax=Prorocentrum cordatum TaxID=2364126 RepID=A0ABN9RXW4_9DINO|nr:unnamed protein product [Polarella glacialis]
MFLFLACLRTGPWVGALTLRATKRRGLPTRTGGGDSSSSRGPEAARRGRTRWGGSPASPAGRRPLPWPPQGCGVPRGVGRLGLGAAGQVEGYLARGVSEDFIQAARALSNRGFGLAAVALAAPPPAPPVPPAPPARGWRGAPGNAPRDPGADLAAGPELARKLIARWCPQAQPAFEVVLGYDLGEAPAGPGVLGQQMQRIAEHYRVPCGKLILISARGRTAKSEDGWLRLAVTDPAEGFRFSDCFATKP